MLGALIRCSAALGATALLACGGSGGLPPGPAGPAAVTGGPGADSRFVEASRTARVPSSVGEGERLVFLRAGAVWIMAPDGSERTALTVRAHHAPDEHPSLTPNGERLVWAAPDDKGPYRVFAMRLDELIPAPISDGSRGGDHSPTISPDGKSVAFVRGAGTDQRQLILANADGSGEIRVLWESDDDRPEAFGAPAFSPDSRELVVAADRRQGQGTLLWIIDVESARIRRLTAPRANAWFVRDDTPVWSPDGQQVVFASNRHVASADDAADTDLYAVGIDGSGLTRLTNDPGMASEPAFSTSGDRLYFTSTRDRFHGYESEIYVMAASGGKQERLTRDDRPENRSPSVGQVK